MAVKAVLEIEGKKLNILEFKYKIEQPASRNGFPSGNPFGGKIILTLESDKDTLIYDWTLSQDAQKEGTIIFYNQDGISKFKEIKFQEAYCILHDEKFINSGEFPMQYTIEISPGNTNYQGSNFTKNWSKPQIDIKNATTFVKEEPVKKKNVEIEDIYLDKSDATVLFNYGKVTGDIRIIDKYDWQDANEISDDAEKVNKLKSDSKVVLVNDIQIQQKIQEIHALTNKVEEQLFIVLNRDTANVEAVLGPEGTDGHTEINAEYKGIGQDDKGKAIYSKSPTIKADGKRYPLLGQVHTHNLMKSEPRNPNQVFGTVETKENGYGTSEIDKGTAMSLGIEIYSLDSWNFYSKTAEVTLNRVDPTGKESKGIGKTIGKGQGKKIVNVGLECLNLKVGRK